MNEWRGIGNVETVSDRATSPAKKTGFDVLTLGSAILTFVLTVDLVRKTVSASWYSSESEIPASDVSSYWVTAGIMLALQVGLLIRAIWRRRGGLVLVSSAALVLALGAVLVLAVPTIDWRPEPPTPTMNPNYSPCYSGSGDCVGG